MTRENLDSSKRKSDTRICCVFVARSTAAMLLPQTNINSVVKVWTSVYSSRTVMDHWKTRQKMALGERRSRESPCFLIVFKWTKTRNKWLAKVSREQKGGILNTTNIFIATELYIQRVFADICSSYLQPETSWHVKINNQDVRTFCDVRNNYAWAIKQLSQHF